MKQGCGGLLPLVTVALVVLLSACQPAPAPTPGASAHPPTTTPTPDQARCARLAQRGFTPCPPTAAQLKLPPTTIKNATNGAVSDTTAQQWGRAFQLTEAYYRWALQANARDALTKGALSDASTQAVANLFASDLMDLDDAKQAGGTLAYDPPAIPITQLVIVPASLQDAIRRQGLAPAAYGVAVRFTGPTRRSIRMPNGAERTVIVRDATFQADGLVWGELRVDPDLGAIWYEHGSYGCQDSVRSVCAL